MFKDVEVYIRKEIFNRDKTPEKRKFLNFCSPIYKRVKRDIEVKSHQGYNSLQCKIRESSKMVKSIKHGKSLFQNAQVSEVYQVPVIKDRSLRKSLVEYIDRSVIEVSVKESQENLKLIETLSP